MKKYYPKGVAMNQNQNQTAALGITPAKTLVLCIFAAVFTIYLAYPVFALACAVITLFLAGVYLTNKKALLLTIAVVILTFVLTMASVSLTATLLALVGAAALGSTLLSKKQSAIAFIVSLCLIYGVAAVLQSPIEALSALMPVPMAITLAVCSKKKLPAVTAICATSAVLVMTLILPVSVSLILEYGKQTIAEVTKLIDSVKTAVVDAVVESYGQLTDEAKAALPFEITTSSIKELTDVFFPLIPAFLIITTNIIAFCTHAVTIWIKNRVGAQISNGERIFAMSKLSAWVYIISFVTMLFSFSDSNLAQTVMMAMMTLNIILMPSFAFVGFISVVEAFRMSGGKIKPIHVILAVLGFMYCGAFIIYPLTVFGVMRTIKTPELPKDTPKN